MALELPPFRATPDERARIHARQTRWGMAAVTGVFLLMLMTILCLWIGLPVIAVVPAAVVGAALAVLFHPYNVREGFRKVTGLPWEEQRVVLDEEALRTTYASGYVVRAPWPKFVRTRRVPEGLLLDLEGRAQIFLPARALDAEAEAFVLRHVVR